MEWKNSAVLGGCCVGIIWIVFHYSIGLAILKQEEKMLDKGYSNCIEASLTDATDGWTRGKCEPDED